MADNTWINIVKENPGHQWPLNIDLTVEVTSFEHQTLWATHHKGSKCVKDEDAPQVDWKENTIGLLTCLDGENTFTTCLHLRVDTLTLRNGRDIKVLFWELTSGKRDVTLADKWIETNFPQSTRINASNFWGVLTRRNQS